jgi:hypothetical protein
MQNPEVRVWCGLRTRVRVYQSNDEVLSYVLRNKAVPIRKFNRKGRNAPVASLDATNSYVALHLLKDCLYGYLASLFRI